MTECTYSRYKLTKKDFAGHKIDELVKELAIYGRVVVTRIRNCDCEISYSASVNRVGLTNLWSSLSSDEGPTATKAIQNTLDVIHRELLMACN